MTRIVVVDNAGQFTHLEHRALRDLGIDTELIDNSRPPESVAADGVILSGGPNIEDIGQAPNYLDAGIPVLGICLGMQLMATELDGEVSSGDYGGYADVSIEVLDSEDSLIGSLYPETRVWASHADEVTSLPTGFQRTARSDVCEIEAMSNPSADLYGVQWHPEVAHTERGEEVFRNFRRICDG